VPGASPQAQFLAFATFPRAQRAEHSWYTRHHVARCSASFAAKASVVALELLGGRHVVQESPLRAASRAWEGLAASMMRRVRVAPTIRYRRSSAMIE